MTGYKADVERRLRDSIENVLRRVRRGVRLSWTVGATMTIALASNLGLAACGDEPGPAPARDRANPLAYEVRSPRGWDDLSKEPPAPLVAVSGQSDTLELQHYFLRGVAGRYDQPVAAWIHVERVPEIIGLDAAVALDRRDLEGLYGDDVRLTDPRSLKVAGEDARTYDARVRLERYPGVQRFVTFKRGAFAAFTITLSAPNRGWLTDSAADLRSIVRSWRWTE